MDISGESWTKPPGMLKLNQPKKAPVEAKRSGRSGWEKVIGGKREEEGKKKKEPIIPHYNGEDDGTIANG